MVLLHIAFFYGILLHDLLAFIDGEGAFAGGEGEAAEAMEFTAGFLLNGRL